MKQQKGYFGKRGKRGKIIGFMAVASLATILLSVTVLASGTIDANNAFDSVMQFLVP